jgi:hypothetical protein
LRVINARTRRAEDCYPARDARQFVKAFHEFTHNAKDSPGVRMSKLVRLRRLKQLLVLRDFLHIPVFRVSFSHNKKFSVFSFQP